MTRREAVTVALLLVASALPVAVLTAVLLLSLGGLR